MRVFDIQQRTQSWDDFRKEGIGSSDISILLGNDSRRTPYMLWQEKCLGFKEEFFVSPQMQNGIDQEPVALAKLQQQENPMLRPLCAAHDKFPYIRCSFDAYSDEAIYEIKTPSSSKTFEEYIFGEIPEKWKDQTRWQMLVSGVRQGYLVFWTGEDYILKKVDWSEDWEKNALHVANSFWESVANFSAPDLTARDLNCIGVPEEKKSLYLEIMMLNDLKKGLDSIEKRRKEVLGQLVNGLEERSTQMGDLRLSFVPESKSTDFKAVYMHCKDMIDKSVDISEFTKTRASYWK